MTTFIKAKLIEAYKHLGVETPEDLRYFVSNAMAYLDKDRERYIEVAKPGASMYNTSYADGVICRLVPLGRHVREYKKEHCTSRKTTVLAFMVTKDSFGYVLIQSWHHLFQNPATSQYGCPFCRFVQLAEIKVPLQPVVPQDVTPVATLRERQIVNLVFLAIAKCLKADPIYFVPCTTERIMAILEHSREEQILLNGCTITGKVIPLAAPLTMFEELYYDHRYSYIQKLCLLVAENQLEYVLQTCQKWQYFREITPAVPGGSSYELTEEKEAFSYQTIALEDVPDDFYPYRYS